MASIAECLKRVTSEEIENPNLLLISLFEPKLFSNSTPNPKGIGQMIDLRLDV